MLAQIVSDCRLAIEYEVLALLEELLDFSVQDIADGDELDNVRGMYSLAAARRDASAKKEKATGRINDR